ncbi:MAG TPA: CBS domain-containing protein [Anaerolineales bacterium]|nr:CBS domain-containing protein [Anaerolineales bacterium]
MYKTTTVRQILSDKGHTVYSITPATTVFDALRTMAEKGIGALVVLDDLNVVGVFSERDYARKVILEGKSSKKLPVEEIMTKKVLFVSPENTTEECVALMSEKFIRHLPVMEDNELIGIVSIGDIMKAIISRQDVMIENLEHYITGGYTPVANK